MCIYCFVKNVPDVDETIEVDELLYAQEIEYKFIQMQKARNKVISQRMCENGMSSTNKVNL